jgi:hypothetical protein
MHENSESASFYGCQRRLFIFLLEGFIIRSAVTVAAATHYETFLKSPATRSHYHASMRLKTLLDPVTPFVRPSHATIKSQV